MNVSDLKQRLFALLSARAMFALLFQGISGLIQVKAFFSLHGPDYLAFTAAYVGGTVLAMLMALNFENMILGGRWTRSVMYYLAANWVLGFLVSGTAWALHTGVPPFLAFCGFYLCSRLFLAWANQAHPSPLSLLLAGTMVLASCVLGDLNLVIVAAMLALPVAAWRAHGPEVLPDAGLRFVFASSALAFMRYLPHTISGLTIGYLDRFLALEMVGGGAAEGYLRSVQVCSWAAFVAYPFLFQARSRLLQTGRLQGAYVFRSMLALSVVIIVSTAMILAVAWFYQRMPPISAPVLMTVLLAIVCSQSYQIVSSLQFVGDQFGTINRVTLSSAAVVVALAFTLVPYWKSAEALALVLLAGWFTQLSLTIAVLRRR